MSDKYKEYNLSDEQIKHVSLAEETLKLYFNNFSKMSYERKQELLDTAFNILVEGLKLDIPTAILIQQLINLKVLLYSYENPRFEKYYGYEARKMIDEEINFIIKIILERFDIDKNER